MSDPKTEGREFVADLHERFGLLEAHRQASSYIVMQQMRGLGESWRDAEEEMFCAGVKEGIVRLDTI